MKIKKKCKIDHILNFSLPDFFCVRHFVKGELCKMDTLLAYIYTNNYFWSLSSIVDPEIATVHTVYNEGQRWIRYHSLARVEDVYSDL